MNEVAEDSSTKSTKIVYVNKEKKEGEAAIYMSGDTVIVSSEGRQNVLQGISPELLHQVLQEVKDDKTPPQPMIIESTKPSDNHQHYPSGSTKPTECNVVFQDESGKTQSVILTRDEAEALGLTPEETSMSHGQVATPTQQEVPRMQIPVTTQDRPVILVPSITPDGTVSYAIQPAAYATSKPTEVVRNMVSTTSKPTTNQNNRISILRPVAKPRQNKVFLPKMVQHQVQTFIKQTSPKKILPHPAQTIVSQMGSNPKSIEVPTNLNIVTQPAVIGTHGETVQKLVGGASANAIRSPVMQRMQLLTGDGSKPIQVIAAGAETSVRSDHPLTSIQLKHITSILQHQKTQRQPTTDNIVYRVVYPDHYVETKNDHAALRTEEYASIKMEEEDDNMDPDSSKELLDENEETFRAIVREARAKKRGRGKVRARGRPRKGMQKGINEKKMLTELRRELGLGQDHAKEFGFFEGDDINEPISEPQRKLASAITRSGRLSRPPKHILKDMKPPIGIGSTMARTYEGQSEGSGEFSNILQSDDKSQVLPTATSEAVTDLTLPPLSVLSPSVTLPPKKKMSPPERYICKVCGKLYLGDKKIARHLKHFPGHGFATPEPPTSVPSKKTSTSIIETWIAETQSQAFLNTVGPRIFQSFSIWDLIAAKTKEKNLGTVETLASLFADVQALVMELKNLVEQCLGEERANEDSFRVTLSPMITSIIGLGRGGGVKRYVLPYNQIPEHYHKLLGFPVGLIDPQLLSPESTNSMIHPEDDSSQMSASSNLGDKMVLEDNLGNRLQELDENSCSISGNSPEREPTAKRMRLDSGSTSLGQFSPGYISQGEDSNFSAVEGNHEQSKQKKTTTEKGNNEEVISKKNLGQKGIITSSSNEDIRKISKSSTKIDSSVMEDDSIRAKLPSFSSIISGSPKPATVQTEDDLNLSSMTQECVNSCAVSAPNQSRSFSEAHLETRNFHASESLSTNNVSLESTLSNNRLGLTEQPSCSHPIIDSGQYQTQSTPLQFEIALNSSTLSLPTCVSDQGPILLPRQPSLLPNYKIPTQTTSIQQFHEKSQANSHIMVSNPYIPSPSMTTSEVSIPRRTIPPTAIHRGNFPAITRAQYSPTSPAGPSFSPASPSSPALPTSPFSLPSLIRSRSPLTPSSPNSPTMSTPLFSPSSVIRSRSFLPPSSPNSVTMSASLFASSARVKSKSSLPPPTPNSPFSDVSPLRSRTALFPPSSVSTSCSSRQSPGLPGPPTIPVSCQYNLPDHSKPIMSPTGFSSKTQFPDFCRMDSPTTTSMSSVTFQRKGREDIHLDHEYQLIPHSLRQDQFHSRRQPGVSNNCNYIQQTEASESDSGNGKSRRHWKKSTSSEELNMNTCTNVTFSDELSRPIPSVSPAVSEAQARHLNITPTMESSNSNIFSDLEDFTFHSALAADSRTPEKLMASVPLAAVMKDKKSSIGFDAYTEESSQPTSPECDVENLSSTTEFSNSGDDVTNLTRKTDYSEESNTPGYTVNGKSTPDDYGSPSCPTRTAYLQPSHRAPTSNQSPIPEITSSKRPYTTHNICTTTLSSVYHAANLPITTMPHPTPELSRIAKPYHTSELSSTTAQSLPYPVTNLSGIFQPTNISETTSQSTVYPPTNSSNSNTPHIGPNQPATTNHKSYSGPDLPSTTLQLDYQEQELSHDFPVTKSSASTINFSSTMPFGPPKQTTTATPMQYSQPLVTSPIQCMAYEVGDDAQTTQSSDYTATHVSAITTAYPQTHQTPKSQSQVYPGHHLSLTGQSTDYQASATPVYEESNIAITTAAYKPPDQSKTSKSIVYPSTTTTSYPELNISKTDLTPSYPVPHISPTTPIYPSTTNPPNTPTIPYPTLDQPITTTSYPEIYLSTQQPSGQEYTVANQSGGEFNLDIQSTNAGNYQGQNQQNNQNYTNSDHTMGEN